MTMANPKNISEKEALSNALGCCIMGDIYGLKKTIKSGFDLSTKEHLCITESARLGHTHIVNYILKEKRPPEGIIKKLTNICTQENKFETLKGIVRLTGIISSKAQDNAQYNGHSQIADYIMDREFQNKIGNFYKNYKHLPERLTKLLCEKSRPGRNGEPAPEGLASEDQQTLRFLRGLIYKNELSVTLQIACRENMKDAAELLYLATKLQRAKNLGFSHSEAMFRNEGRNSPLTFIASFGTIKDYIELRKEGIFINPPLQRNNLGYTISLAIKNKNFEVATALIEDNFCPLPSLIPNTLDAKDPEAFILSKPLKEVNEMFDMVIKNLLNSQDTEESQRLLKKVLDLEIPTTSHKNRESRDTKTEKVLTSKIDNIDRRTEKVKDVLAYEAMQKRVSKYIVHAVQIGREDMAKELLKSLPIKTLLKKNFFDLRPPVYAIKWLEDFQKRDMIGRRNATNLTLSID